MLAIHPSLQLPDYQTYIDALAVLALPFSGSELHGVMCGYLAAGCSQEGEAYVRALMHHQNETATRTTALMLFGIYAVSQQQITNFGFEFQFLLPDDHAPLLDRAQAFSEWCEGFIQGLTLAGINYNQLEDEDAQEAMQHFTEFAHLDYQSLQVDEDDERSLMEVTEYARMAVIYIFSDVQAMKSDEDGSEVAH